MKIWMNIMRQSLNRRPGAGGAAGAVDMARVPKEGGRPNALECKKPPAPRQPRNPKGERGASAPRVNNQPRSNQTVPREPLPPSEQPALRLLGVHSGGLLVLPLPRSAASADSRVGA